MNAVSALTAAANENATPFRLVLCITDPEVAHEIACREDGPERDAFAKQALRIGILALRQASGALDSQTIQREGERMLASLREALTAHTSQTTSSLGRLLGGYLDPASGTLPQRLDRLTKRDGELEAMLAKHLDGDRSTVARTLARQVGQESPIFKLLSPEQTEGVVGAISTAVDDALKVQREELLAQFSLDSPDSALSRLVADVTGANGKLQRSVLEQLSLDCEGSAMRRLSSVLDATRAVVEKRLTLDDTGSPLSRLREELMKAVGAFSESSAQFQSEVRATLATFKVRREEAARSSLHGHTFEYAVGDVLGAEALGAGDLCERLSGVPGKEGRKTGDYVVTLGPESAAPGARIVVECKADKGYGEAQALDELALARKNREAGVGVFVLARESAKEGFATFRRIGTDVLVVWDAEDLATDVYLKAAMSVARALVVQQHATSDGAEAGMGEVEESAAAIERMITTVESIARDARSIVKRGTRIGKAAEGVRERLEGEVVRLRGVVEGGA
jgi:hypothetical protein